MTRIFNSKAECLNKVRYLKSLQKQRDLRRDIIPQVLRNSSQWIVWSYEDAGRKNGKFGVDKVPYQARNPTRCLKPWDVSDWDDLETALECALTNPDIDGIGYFFSENDGLVGVDFDNCRDPETGKICKEYQFWIDKLDGYAEVSPSGTGVKVWVKGIIDNRCFRNDEDTGFRIPNFAGGVIEIYRRGQYFTVTTQVLEGFESIKPAQEALDVLSEFYLSGRHNDLFDVSGGWVSGELALLEEFEDIKLVQEESGELALLEEFEDIRLASVSGELAPNVVGNLPKSAKARLGTGYLTGKIVYSPDGDQLVVPKSTGIWVYDTSTLKVIDIIDENKLFSSAKMYKEGYTQIEADNAVGFSEEGNLFAIRAKRPRFTSVANTLLCTLQIWTKETGQSKSIPIEGPRTKRDSMVFSPDGNILAASFEDGTIYLWNVHTGELQDTLTVESEKIKSMFFSLDGSMLAFTSAVPGIFDRFDYFIDVWDTRTGMRKFNRLDADYLLGFSPDGQMLAGRRRHYYGSTVSLWKADTGSCKFTFSDFDSSCNPIAPPHPDIDISRASSLAFSPDGLTLATFSDDTIYLWDLHTRNCKSTFTDTGYITSLVFSPDGRTLAGGCKDGTVLLWNVDSAGGETTLMDVDRSIVPKSSIDNDSDKTVLTEGNAEFQNRASEIQQFCEDRGITTLCHFTRVENLQSILQEGLIGRSVLEAREQEFLWNDADRADGRKEAVCLSVSFPNYKMFWDIRMKKKNTEGIRDSQWVVLLLDAKVLWELDCAFCQTNAASGAVIPLLSDERIGEQKKFEGLEGMFAEDYYHSKRKIQISRQNLQIPKHYTTDPQAEVLVFNPISVKCIKAVHFYQETALKQWLSINLSIYSEIFSSNRDYFDGRKDSAFWKEEI